MKPWFWFILFVFGIVFGSFLNVIATRYDGEHFLLSTRLIGGRSHCTHCKKTLRWFELVPFGQLCRAGWPVPTMRIEAQHPISDR